MAVQRMQDYILKHLCSEITLAQLAKAAWFSPWYAHRLFKEKTGLAPAEYIRRLRLTEAAKRLKSEGCRIIDVAMDLGFASVDGFTRAFYREYGINPAEYRHRPVPITLFVPYSVSTKNIVLEKRSMENTKMVFIKVIEKPAHKVLIKRGKTAEDYFAYCGEVGCDIWGKLLSMDSLCGEPVCLWLPRELIAPNSSRYVQGVEVPMSYNGIVPEDFDVIELKDATYLMFQGEPFLEEDFCQAIVSLQRAMDGYDPTVIGYSWDDSNPRIQLEPRGERGYIELRAVKPL